MQGNWLTMPADYQLTWRGGLLIGLTLLAVGCGSQEYQQRLQETVQYFEYKDRINRELGRAWGEKNISLRPPQQFKLVPPPSLPDIQEGEDTQTLTDLPADPRQPHDLGLVLPGLVAAWEAEVDADVGEADFGQTASLYVLSNYDRYLQQEEDGGDGENPQSFLADVENLLGGAIGVFLPDDNSGSAAEKNHRYLETVPSRPPNDKYRRAQKFTAVTYSPQIEIADVPIEMQLYEWKGDKIQVAILMIYPAGISPHEDLQDRLLLALETLEATDQSPSRTGAGASESDAGRRGSAF